MDKLTIRQLEQSYRSAIKKMKEPYERVLDITEEEEPTMDFEQPPKELRYLFGVKD